MAADARGGGIGGISIGLIGLILIIGFTYALVMNLKDHLAIQIVAVIFSGVSFGEVFWFGFQSLPKFGFQESGPIRPIKIGTIIYIFAATIVYLRLHRRISPVQIYAKEVPKELYRIHFLNSWRMFQVIASLTAFVIIGMLFPLGTVLIKRQEVILQPLALFVGGLLWGFVPLTIQLRCEMAILERRYKSDIHK